MLVVETVVRIRREHASGKAIKAIARDLRLSRKVVRKAIRSPEAAFNYQRTVQPLPRIGPYQERLDVLLEENEARGRRDRLRMTRIHDLLAREGFEGSYDAVLHLSPVLERSSARRALSKTRYSNAESFIVAIEERFFSETGDLLYQTGIVAQLALTSHLLDVGFDDRWCARHIGLHIDRAMAYANATGLNYRSPAFERLAPVLSPYNIWRNPNLDGSRPAVPASLPDIPPLLRELLNHVRGVTGHARPRRRKTRG